jgi:murein DD-endopeptidase MepM/ murein hydrolase activator NlpD
VKKLLRYFAILLIAVFSTARAGTTPFVFDDDWGIYWHSWSWPSSPVPAARSTTQAFKGSYSVKMNFNAPWAGFSPGADIEFDTTGYTALTFAVYNESNAGQLYLRATMPDVSPGVAGQQTNPSLYLQDYTTGNSIPQGQWTWIRIPIADLNLGPNPKIYYFSIQNATVGTAYFDEIRFEANTTLYEGVKQQGGPTVQRFNWSSTITQLPATANQPDYYLSANITSAWGGVQFHEVMKFSGTLPSTKYGILTALFQKTSSASQSIIANLIGEGNVVSGGVNLDNYVANGISVGTWYRVLIPFADFGTVPANLDGVVFSGATPGTFLLDDVKFVENLKFPLAGWTGATAKITSAMDHSMIDPFCGDGVVTAFSGEVGSASFGQSNWNYPSPNGPCIGQVLRGYKQDFTGTPFSLHNQYVASSPPDTTAVLFYDGHPGIDYKADTPLPVTATASGKITVNDCSTSPCSNFGVIRIDHGYWLTTSYNHMSAIASGLSVGSYVTKGQALGTSGHTGLAAGTDHLHISTLWGKSSPRYIDPQGWKDATHPDPYTWAKNVCLWEGGC